MGRRHRLGRPGELAQHDAPGVVDPARNVLLGHEVHPVFKGRHEQCICGAVQGDELVDADALAEVVHGRSPHLAEVAVQLADETLYLDSLVKVGRDVVSTSGTAIWTMTQSGTEIVPSASSSLYAMSRASIPLV